MFETNERLEARYRTWTATGHLFGVGFELSTALDTKVHLHEVRRGRKERKKDRILNIRVGKRSTRGTRHSGGGETVKRNESAMMCRTSRTNGHSYVRREIFIGEKERARERKREEKRDDQTRIM